jgi:diguanylate cyclase (GGDEF)-like protein
MTAASPLPPSTVAIEETEELHRLRLSRDAALRAAQSAVRDATRLTRLMTILNDAGSLETLLDRALSTLTELFAADVVVLLDPIRNGSFVPVAAIGLPEDLAELAFSDAADGNVQKTMREGGALLVGDAAADPSVEPQLQELDVATVLYLPVIASHAARGVLILARCRHEPFVFADVGLLTAMAYRIGLAVEQAQRRSQLERIVHCEREIGLDLEEARVAHRAVVTFPALVGADAATLVRLDESGRIVFRADAGDGGIGGDDLVRVVAELLARPEIRRLETVSLVVPSPTGGEGAGIAAGGSPPLPAGALLALPFGRNGPEGLLLAFRSAPTPFDPDIPPIAVLYAGQVAAALENARLYRAVHNELADRQRAEQALKGSEERLGALIRSVHDLIVVIGATGEVHFANPAAARVWSTTAGEDPTAEFWRRMRSEDRSRLAELVDVLSCIPGETRCCTVALLHGTAEWHDYDVTLTNLIGEPAVVGFVATFHDITERRIHERRLEDLAFRDPLTGLANRAYFQDRLRRALTREGVAATIAVIFFDLDDFKVVNDSLGHDAGDLILTAVAARMGAEIGPRGLGARLGGDEFTVLLEHDATLATAREIADRLLGAIRVPVTIGDREVVVGGSFGIALGRSGIDTADELLRKADMAMYHAKATGRNRCSVFSSGLAVAAVRRLEEETALRAALARGELEAFFQPVVRLADRRPIGAEALVRWRHPARGSIPLGEFIPIAEATGLVIELGRTVIEQSFRRQWEWRRQSGISVPLGLNLSPRQLLDEGLVEGICEEARRFDVEPAGITFEITENTLVENHEVAAEMLRRLRGHGFRVVIDDFGKGYSNLAYLKTLPVDGLKIDRSFVRGVETDPRDRAIVASILSLAEAFGLTVVTEGIETAAQAEILAGLGCSVAQGHLFAPALPADEFAALLPLFGGGVPTWERAVPASGRVPTAR